MNTVSFKALLVFSEEENTFFYEEFQNGINIIKGKNTSGKSTLIQSIIYSFAINDGYEKLFEILDKNVIFRLDFEIKNINKTTNYSFIRDNYTFFIIEENKLPQRFDGISGNSSTEHIKLKSAISSIFGFSLVLESKNELKEAPIETILLPYYISQSVGWVYLRESFSGLNFYKNFKQDFLDYYLGITTDIDRIAIQELLIKQKELKAEIEFFRKMMSKNESLELSKLIDEKYKAEATKYLQGFTELRDSLIKEEREHIKLSNQKSLSTNRVSVLRRVKKNIATQRPELDHCPVCVQLLPNTLEELYSYNQNVNDTSNELEKIKLNIKEIQSKINSSNKKIEKLNEKIEKDYALLANYFSENLTFSSWLDHKSNIKLVDNINKSIGEKLIQLSKVEEDLSDVDEDDTVNISRRTKEKQFRVIFIKNLKLLGVSLPSESRYTDLYKISSFPFQGVELHKTVMAYHFSLNELISKTNNIHRMPFLLDAIMKEDIDIDSRRVIFNFINQSYPKDTQVFFTVSESKEQSLMSEESTMNIEGINKKFFMDKGNIIQIGDGINERKFLSSYSGENKTYVDETLEIIYSN
jgi:archaellum component FlaC